MAYHVATYDPKRAETDFTKPKSILFAKGISCYLADDARGKMVFRGKDLPCSMVLLSGELLARLEREFPWLTFSIED